VIVNSRHCDPHIFHFGDIVFARRATCSNAARCRVGKLEFVFTGPWQVMADLPGGSYTIKHCHHPNQRDKKQALSLTPYPNNLIPLWPNKGPNTQFSQLYCPIDKHPFKEAGINGFTLPAPFCMPAPFIDIGNFKDFCWPLLSELNNKIDPFPWYLTMNGFVTLPRSPR
jgi:hypothetical protein